VICITSCYNTIELQDAAMHTRTEPGVPGSLVGKLIENAISTV
jgi:hypothetical protein